MSELKLEDLNPKTELEGTVKRIELTGALLDVGLGYDALLLNANMSRKGAAAPRSSFAIGDKVKVWVLSVDDERGFITVTTNKPSDLEWASIQVGDVFKGRVIRIKKFGVFVDIGAERPGLVHISELAHEYVAAPQDKVQRGEELDVKVIGLDVEKKQIDLSVKALDVKVVEKVVEQQIDESYEEMPTAMALAFEKARVDGKPVNPKAEKKRSAQKMDNRDEIFKRTLKGRED